MRRRVALGGCGVAGLSYLGSLTPLGWAASPTEQAGFFALLSTSSPISSGLGVMFLLLTLVALGLVASAVHSGPPRSGWYARGAGLAALLDLGCVGGLGYRIATVGDGIVPGPGWYLAVSATLAAGVAAVVVPTRA